jgi:hypothetical protein
MIDSTFNILDFRTVPSTYSWDQGTPETTDFSAYYLSGIRACSAVSLVNEDGIEYVGYAPYAAITLSSEPGTISDSYLALHRIVNFGDYYNSETNSIQREGLRNETFCHVYIMPGTYTITYEVKEYIQQEIEPISTTELCLQKHCLDWSFKTLAEIKLDTPITWKSTKTNEQYQKTWKYEPCETEWASNKGLYVQSTGKQPRLPLSWQWYNFLSQSPNPYNEELTWLSANFQSNEQLTWAQSTGPCLGKSSVQSTTWKWDRTGCQGGPFDTPITWDETSSVSPFNTTWDYSKQNCEGTLFPLLSTGVATKTKTAIVRVLEIPPIAYLSIEDPPTDKSTPFKVRLTARHVIPGSFPIEKIVWDLGDGSPLLTQRRWSPTLEPPFEFNGSIINDYEDPRNYDVIYTYTRTITSSSCFYPSITAYASSTNTSDQAACLVGPITLPVTAGTNFKLLQNELTNDGKVFLGQIDNSVVSLWRAETAIRDPITLKYVYPYLGYWSADAILMPNQSRLYLNRYSNSKPVKSLSGIGDIDREGNIDLWYTDENGLVNWEMVIYYPYTHLGFYSDDQVLIKNQSKLYSSQGSAAIPIADNSGYQIDIDKDGDGDEDTWTTNSDGIISWTKTIYHPYPTLDYYANKPLPYKTPGEILWHTPYSSSSVVKNASGTADIDADGHLDIWQTNFFGGISWSKIIVHPHERVYHFTGGNIINISTNATTVAVLTGSKKYVNEGIKILSGGSFAEFSFVTEISSSLSALETVVFYSSNKQALDYIVANQHNAKYFTDNNQLIVGVLSGASFGGYFSDDNSIINGTSFIWNNQGTGATKVTNVSGQGDDINEDGNGDAWVISETGRISYYMLTAYPYFHFGHYSLDAVLRNKLSRLYTGIGDGSVPLALAAGNDDVDLDGNLDSWSTDRYGRITFSKIIAHPRVHFGGYFSDDLNLVSENSVIWNGNGTGATRVALLTGLDDVNKDGNLDNWSTDAYGVITYSKAILHPYIHLGIYYCDDPQLINGYSILWTENGSKGVPVANSTGTFEIDGDGNEDIWYTNSAGRIAWVQNVLHPYSQFGYYADVEILRNGIDILWYSNLRDTPPVISLTGLADVDNDGNSDQWSTDNQGIITWYMVSAHPYPILGYYTDFVNLTSGASVLYSGQGTGATIINNRSGISDIELDGNNDQWSTNANGVLSWYMISAHPYRQFAGYYTDEPTLNNGYSVIWNNQGTSGVIAANVLSAVNDVDGDGNDDVWRTDVEGIIFWYMISAHPHINLGYNTDTPNLINGTTVLWNGAGTGATRVINVSGTADIDNDGGIDAWSTDTNGVITWTRKFVHNFEHIGYFADNEVLSSGIDIIWYTREFDSGAVINLSGLADVDKDSNLDAWSTNNQGIITWYMVSAYPYSNLGYYTETPNIINNVTRLWNDKGTGATAAVNLSGIYDFDLDGGNEQWSTDNNGVVSYFTISAHPYYHFGYYSDDPVLIKHSSVLWNDWRTNATVAKFVSGVGFLDTAPDRFADAWQTDEHGVITWQAIPVIGRYWSSNANTDWYDLNNWYVDSSLLSGANTLPLSSTDVVIISGGLVPYIDLDDRRWREPRSINATNTGLNFYSKYGAGILSELSGTPITFMGNSKYGFAAPLIYWYSTTNSDWYSPTNWYRDYLLTEPYNALPTSGTRVAIASGGNVPYVDIDDSNWIQPIYIDAVGIGVTFYSNSSAAVTCDLFGSPITFAGNSTFGI